MGCRMTDMSEACRMARRLTPLLVDAFGGAAVLGGPPNTYGDEVQHLTVLIGNTLDGGWFHPERADAEWEITLRKIR